MQRDENGQSFATGEDSLLRDQVLAGLRGIEDWQDPVLEVVGEALDDYLANDIGVRLCSPRLRELIDDIASENDAIHWLDARVVFERSEFPFFVLHFLSFPDVLDPIKTLRARGGFVVRPVVSRARLQGHKVFSFAGGVTRLIVDSDIRNAVEYSRCTGVDFAPVRMS